MTKIWSNIKLLLSKGLNICLQPAALRSCSISKKSKVCSGSNLSSVSIDDYSYMGHHCFCVNTAIGRFTSISDNCCIGGAAHPIEFVSTSPVFHKGNNVLKKNFAEHPFKTTQETYIGNDVWIGMGAYIKSGVTISDGAVIGMGSVVTKDVGPYEIWAGNPAKLIRKRFTDATIDQLCSTKWWTWEEEKISEYSVYFNDPEELIRKVKAK